MKTWISEDREMKAIYSNPKGKATKRDLESLNKARITKVSYHNKNK